MPNLAPENPDCAQGGELFAEFPVRGGGPLGENEPDPVIFGRFPMLAEHADDPVIYVDGKAGEHAPHFGI